jgi:peptidoglycan-associated lipoprotein
MTSHNCGKVLYGLSGLFFVVALQGCLATRGWVTEQMTPVGERVSEVERRVSEVDGRVSDVDSRLGQTNARVDGVIDRLDHLRLERRFVLNLREGANFASNSGALTPETRRAVDGFLSDLQEADDAIFLVAGHTDSTGPENHNYELGQKRAASVARYLTTKGIDPLRVTAVSYGESAPLAENTTQEGRRKNRRIEILVYKEVITSSVGRAAPSAEARERGEAEIPVGNR